MAGKLLMAVGNVQFDAACKKNRLFTVGHALALWSTLKILIAKNSHQTYDLYDKASYSFSFKKIQKALGSLSP